MRRMVVMLLLLLLMMLWTLLLMWLLLVLLLLLMLLLLMLLLLPLLLLAMQMLLAVKDLRLRVVLGLVIHRRILLPRLALQSASLSDIGHSFELVLVAAYGAFIFHLHPG